MASVQHLQRIFLADVENENKYQHFYNCTLALGVLVGVIVQLSTMFVNWMIVSFIVTTQESTRNLIIFSFCWTTLTSISAFVVLGNIRRHLGIAHHRISHQVSATKHCVNDYHDDYDTESESENDYDVSDGYTESIVHVEHRFVVGAIIGVCLSWAMTDLILGLKKELFYSIVTLAIGLLWCHFVLYLPLARDKWAQQKRVQNKPYLDHSYVAIL